MSLVPCTKVDGVSYPSWSLFGRTIPRVSRSLRNLLLDEYAFAGALGH
jgi:hypothetical protein